MNELEKLKIEREKLRKEVRGKSISSWKIWQHKKDMILLDKLDRICKINNILIGARLQQEISQSNENTEKSK